MKTYKQLEGKFHNDVVELQCNCKHSKIKLYKGDNYGRSLATITCEICNVVWHIWKDKNINTKRKIMEIFEIMIKKGADRADSFENGKIFFTLPYSGQIPQPSRKEKMLMKKPYKR